MTSQGFLGEDDCFRFFLDGATWQREIVVSRTAVALILLGHFGVGF